MKKLDYTSPDTIVVVMTSLKDTLAATSPIPDVTEREDVWDDLTA